jgi:hypothetical protein
MRQRWKTYEPYCVRRCHVKGVTEAYFEVRGSGIEPNMDQTNERPLTDHTDQTNEHAEPDTTKPNERAPHRERERSPTPAIQSAWKLLQWRDPTCLENKLIFTIVVGTAESCNSCDSHVPPRGVYSLCGEAVKDPLIEKRVPSHNEHCISHWSHLRQCEQTLRSHYHSMSSFTYNTYMIYLCIYVCLCNCVNVENIRMLHDKWPSADGDAVGLHVSTNLWQGWFVRVVQTLVGKPIGRCHPSP